MTKFIFSLCIAALMLTYPVTAQDFEVAPVEVVFRIDPGQKQDKVIMITNHSSSEQQFQLSKADFRIGVDGSREVMKENSSEHSCSEWISYGDGFFSLNPNESKSISISMTAPEDDYATRWGMIYIQTTQARTAFDADYEKIAAGVLISGRIGVKVFRYPLNAPKPIVKISNLRKVESNTQDDKTFRVDIENKGASVGNCKISYVVLNLKTAEKQSYEVDKVVVLPGTMRQLEFSIDKDIPPGEYALSAILDFGDKNVLEGTRMQSKLVIPAKDE